MFEELILFATITLITCAAFAWIFLIFLIISKLTNKPVLEETKPYKMFFCTGLLTIVALIINAGSGLRGIVGLTSFLDIISNPFLEMLITTATQLVLSYIILLKFQFRKKEAALCAIVITIFTSIYVLGLIGSIYSNIIWNTFFQNTVESMTDSARANLETMAYSPLYTFLTLFLPLIILFITFTKIAVSQVRDWEITNAKRFKGKIYLFSAIFAILILITGIYSINSYNETKQYYESLIAAEQEAEMNAPTAFEFISESLTNAINQGYYQVDLTRIKGGDYEVTAQELANKTGIDKSSIIIIVPEKYNNILQSDGTNLIGSKKINQIGLTIICKNTLEKIQDELYPKDYSKYTQIIDIKNTACNDVNSCCVIFANPYY